MGQEKELAINLPLQISEIAKGVVFVAISVLSFFIPFALGHPQWLVGTIVNACLFLGAIYLPKRYYIPLAILPSLGVLARGLIFGPLTMFLVYFLPLIWLGNLILILLFKKIWQGGSILKTKSGTINFASTKYLFSMFCASAFKFIFLLIVANIYFAYDIVPKIFLSSMGLNQLADALAGGLIALIIFKIFSSYGKSFPRLNKTA